MARSSRLEKYRHRSKKGIFSLQNQVMVGQKDVAGTLILLRFSWAKIRKFPVPYCLAIDPDIRFRHASAKPVSGCGDVISLSSHSVGLPRRQSRHFTAERQRITDIVFVQFAREAVSGIGRPGYRTWRLGIAYDLDRANATVGPFVAPRFQGAPDLVVLLARRPGLIWSGSGLTSKPASSIDWPLRYFWRNAEWNDTTSGPRM